MHVILLHLPIKVALLARGQSCGTGTIMWHWDNHVVLGQSCGTGAIVWHWGNHDSGDRDKIDRHETTTQQSESGVLILAYTVCHYQYFPFSWIVSYKTFHKKLTSYVSSYLSLLDLSYDVMIKQNNIMWYNEINRTIQYKMAVMFHMTF